MTTTLEKVKKAIMLHMQCGDFGHWTEEGYLVSARQVDNFCIASQKAARAAIQALMDMDNDQIWRAAVNAKPGFANLWRATHQAILDEQKETA